LIFCGTKQYGLCGGTWVNCAYWISPPPKLSRNSLKNLGHTILKCYIAMVCLFLIYTAPLSQKLKLRLWLPPSTSLKFHYFLSFVIFVEQTTPQTAELFRLSQANPQNLLINETATLFYTNASMQNFYWIPTSFFSIASFIHLKYLYTCNTCSSYSIHCMSVYCIVSLVLYSMLYTVYTLLGNPLDATKWNGA